MYRMHLLIKSFKFRLFEVDFIGRIRTSLVAQTEKNLPVVQDTWVQSLGQKDFLRREWQPTPVFLPEKSHGQRRLAGYSPWGCRESGMPEGLSLSLFILVIK